MGFFKKKFFKPPDFEERGRKGAMEPGTEDTSMFEQIEVVECDIRKLSFVTISSPVRVVKDKGEGYGVCLTCYRCKEHS